ncbi:MAG: ribosome silencing factor [Casimicrobiaceae bacterium]
MRLTKAQKAAITALEDIKARDISTLDTRKLTSMFDLLIIATADSARQTKALARNVYDKVKAAGGSVLSTEGEDTGEWVLVDCADFVVHIMQPAARGLYNLEELWTPPAPRPRLAKAKPAKAVPAPGTPAAKPRSTANAARKRTPVAASAAPTADSATAAKAKSRSTPAAPRARRRVAA